MTIEVSSIIDKTPNQLTEEETMFVFCQLKDFLKQKSTLDPFSKKNSYLKLMTNQHIEYVNYLNENFVDNLAYIKKDLTNYNGKKFIKINENSLNERIDIVKNLSDIDFKKILLERSLIND